MIQIILGILLVFVYPFLSKTWSAIMLLLVLLFTIIAFFILDDADSSFKLLISNTVLVIVGNSIRRFWQREKSDLEMDDLKKMYENKKEQE